MDGAPKTTSIHDKIIQCVTIKASIKTSETIILTLFLMLGTMMSSEAASQMSNAEQNKTVEEKKEWTNSFTDVRYGPLTLQSEVLNAVFTGSNHQSLLIDTGVEFMGVLGLSFGSGMIREKGYLLSVDGTSSSQEDTLTVLPFNVSATLRLDFFNEQLLVPFANAGVDYWLWQEKWTSNDVATAMTGGKQGYHYSYGGQILLDRFDEASASLMEVRRGVTDTYLTVEYRVQEMDDEGLSFDSESVTVGFRFQY